MLQVTPRVLGSFATVAVKSWLPPLGRLAEAGATETETLAGGAVPSPQPKASVRRRRSSRRIANVVLMCPLTLEFELMGRAKRGPLEAGGLPRTFRVLADTLTAV